MTGPALYLEYQVWAADLCVAGDRDGWRERVARDGGGYWLPGGDRYRADEAVAWREWCKYVGHHVRGRGRPAGDTALTVQRLVIVSPLTAERLDAGETVSGRLRAAV